MTRRSIISRTVFEGIVSDVVTVAVTKLEERRAGRAGKKKNKAMQITVNKDFQPVVRALRKQGWALEKRHSGWQAKPPAGVEGGLVHFSESSDPHALKNTINDLKRNGFTWPPAGRREGTSRVRRTVEITDGEGTRVESMLVRTHPPTSPSPPPEAEPEPIEGQFEPELGEEDDDAEADRIFTRLKAARDEAKFSRELRDDCRRIRDEAQADLDKAEEGTTKADEALREIKAEFDRFFGDGGS